MARRNEFAKMVERLGAIILRLEKGESVGIADLAQEFGVSERTIQRDFSERLAHAKLGRVHRTVRLKSLGGAESLDDRVTLSLLRSIAFVADSEFGAKASKLLNRLRHNNDAFVMEDISDRVSDIALITEAIALRHILVAFYSTETKEREVKLRPLKLVCKQGRWFVVSLRKSLSEVREFELSALSRIALSDRTFENPHAIAAIER
ncbi:transcriptional regulator [Campylobacterota bacterium]|nr:transcriptional regulator [Campylobacterota bacterium]